MNPSQIHLRGPPLLAFGLGEGVFFVPRALSADPTSRSMFAGSACTGDTLLNMVTASIYVRLSSDPRDTRAGVDNQREECMKLCEQLGFEVGDIYEDNDLSATSGVRRPAFEELLASEPEAIVAWHQDRLLRTTADLERVIDLGVNIHMVKAGHLDLSHPAGRAVARTVAAWSTYEGEIKAERQRLSNRARAKEGKAWWARRPFGNNMDGSLNVKEAEAIQWAMKHVLAGGSFMDVEREYARRGLTSGRGNRWRAAGIRSMLMAPRVAGLKEYNGEIVGPGQWEAPAPRDLWEAFVALCKSRPPNSGGGMRMHLLTGVAICDVCEKTVRGASRHYKGRKRYTYACPRSHVSRPVPFVDGIVSERVCMLLSRPDVVAALSAPTDDDLGALRAAQDLLKTRLDGAAQAYAAGAISLDQLTTISADVGGQIEANRKKLAQTTKGSPLTALLEVEDVEQWWGALEVGLKREVVTTLFEVRIQRTKKGYVPRPENIVTTPVGGVAQVD